MPRKSSQDTDGPAGVASTTRQLEQAILFGRLCDKWARSTRSWPILRSISLYPPKTSRNGQWLVVGKAWGEGIKLVAFNRSSDPFTALLGFLLKAQQGTLNWKEDKWVEPPLHD